VQVVDCTPVEPFEAFTFGLDTEHNGVISRASSRISIVDNDTIVPTPKLFVRDAVVDEKDGNALVLGLAGRPHRPGLEQHRHRPLRDRERQRDRL
jgi:chitinase